MRAGIEAIPSDQWRSGRLSQDRRFVLYRDALPAWQSVRGGVTKRGRGTLARLPSRLGRDSPREKGAGVSTLLWGRAGPRRGLHRRGPSACHRLGLARGRSAYQRSGLSPAGSAAGSAAGRSGAVGRRKREIRSAPSSRPFAGGGGERMLGAQAAERPADGGGGGRSVALRWDEAGGRSGRGRSKRRVTEIAAIAKPMFSSGVEPPGGKPGVILSTTQARQLQED